MSWFSIGSSFLNAVRGEVSGIEVTLERDGLPAPAAIRATPTRAEDDHQTRFGGIIEEEDCEWIMLATDYHLGGDLHEPARGDILKETVTGKKWQVMGDEDNPTPWDWHDNSRTSYRIKTTACN